MRRKVLIGVSFVIAWLAGPVLFLWQELHIGQFGFPLDDSWIHQTYARSLAAGTGWSYAGGPPSAGSTSPAWTFLQVPSYWFSISPIVWSLVLGSVLLIVNAILVYHWIRSIYPQAALAASIFTLLEWHLVWAGLSGMETLLFTAWISGGLLLVAWIRAHASDDNPDGISLGFAGFYLGLGIWIRPDAVLFSGVALLAACYYLRKYIRNLLPLLALSGLALVLYFLFEYALHGMIWPNTFYAKPAEYLTLSSQNIVLRILQSLVPLAAGPMAILFLCLIPFVLFVAHRREWALIWPLAWAASHVAVFSLQLPANYQHGRYFMPLLPVLMGNALIGVFYLHELLRDSLLGRILAKSAVFSAGVLLVIFLWLGSLQFAKDVGLIDTEMVAASQWISSNTPRDAVVAAHDVGALGYFGGRSIVDLGGLTSLDALPFLEGNVTLAEFLDAHPSNYLMTFPGLYSSSLQNCLPVFQTSGGFSPSQGGENMAVFEWKNGCENPIDGPK